MKNIKKIEHKIDPFSFTEIKEIVKNNKLLATNHLSELLFLLSIFMILFFSSNIKRKIFLIVFLFYIAIIVSTMNTYLRFPPWVSKPIFLFTLLNMLLLGRIQKINISKISVWTAGLFIVFGLNFIISSMLELDREVIFQNISAVKRKNTEKELSSLGKKAIFYILPNISFFPRNSVYHKTDNANIFNLASGWGTFSPYFYNKIKLIGINTGSDILPWMINHSNTYFITDYKNYTADYPNRLVQFIDETYMIKCSVENIKYFDRFLIFRLNKTDSKLENNSTNYGLKVHRMDCD